MTKAREFCNQLLILFDAVVRVLDVDSFTFANKEIIFADQWK